MNVRNEWDYRYGSNETVADQAEYGKEWTFDDVSRENVSAFQECEFVSGDSWGRFTKIFC